MIYQILNYIFGWDYILWDDSIHEGVARVRINPSGVIYYWKYKSIKVMKTLSSPEQVFWLTCKPEKYFKEDKSK